MDAKLNVLAGKCAFCGRLRNTKTQQLFCSKSCAAKARKGQKRGPYGPNLKRRSGKIISCMHCGREVYKRSAILAKGTPLYCSSKCWRADFKRRGIRPGAKKKGTYVPCSICGKSFWQVPSQGNRRTCSRRCYEIARYGRPVGSPRLCRQCGQPTRNKTYCSRRCWLEWKRSKRPRCPICGKVVSHRANVYCSCRCSGIAQRRAEKWDVSCPNCGKSLSMTRESINSQFHRFCNERCYRAFQARLWVDPDRFAKESQALLRKIEACSKLSAFRQCERRLIYLIGFIANQEIDVDPLTRVRLIRTCSKMETRLCRMKNIKNSKNSA